MMTSTVHFLRRMVMKVKFLATERQMSHERSQGGPITITIIIIIVIIIVVVAAVVIASELI